MELTHKQLLLGGGLVAGAAVLVLFLKGNAGGSASSQSGGVTDIVGGFASAGTVYVPTSSYDLQYNTYKGAVSYSTSNNIETTTYSGSGSGVFKGSPIVGIPTPASPPPTITTSGGTTINPVTQPTHAAPAPSAPSHPTGTATKTATPTTAKMGGLHYATPKGGWNSGSVVDYVKAHGGYADPKSISKLAGEVGISGYSGTAAQNKSLLSKLRNKYGA
jgi:hypothetical protein